MVMGNEVEHYKPRDFEDINGFLDIPEFSEFDYSDKYIARIYYKGSLDFEKLVIVSDEMIKVIEKTGKYGIEKMGMPIPTHRMYQLRKRLIPHMGDRLSGLFEVNGANLCIICNHIDGYTYELRRKTRKDDATIKELKARLETLKEDNAKLQDENRNLKNGVSNVISSQKPKAGYVYLLRMVNGQYWKIGRTNNPKKRVDKFEVTLPFPVECEHIVQTDDMYKLERDLHQQFASKRKSGEWFALTSDDIAYIKTL